MRVGCFPEFLNKSTCIDCSPGFPSSQFPVVKFFSMGTFLTIQPMLHHNYRHFRGAALRNAITVGLGSQLIAVPALWAQDAEPAAKSLQSTVITGSLLTGAEAEGSLSVTPIDMASPVNGGFANLSDVFRLKLPQMAGTGNLNEGYGNGG